MVKLGTFVALGVRGVKSLRIGVLTWVSFMLKWVKQIEICEFLNSTQNPLCVVQFSSR